MEVYTPEQVAQILQLSVGTIWKYIRDGKLPASKIARGYRITDDQLKRFLEQQEVKPDDKQEDQGETSI